MNINEFKKEIETRRHKLLTQFRAKGRHENFGRKEAREIDDLYMEHFFSSDTHQKETLDMSILFYNWCEEYR